jgi:hypothetical protein
VPAGAPGYSLRRRPRPPLAGRRRRCRRIRSAAVRSDRRAAMTDTLNTGLITAVFQGRQPHRRGQPQSVAATITLPSVYSARGGVSSTGSPWAVQQYCSIRRPARSARFGERGISPSTPRALAARVADAGQRRDYSAALVGIVAGASRGWRSSSRRRSESAPMGKPAPSR